MCITDSAMYIHRVNIIIFCKINDQLHYFSVINVYLFCQHPLFLFYNTKLNRSVSWMLLGRTSWSQPVHVNILQHPSFHNLQREREKARDKNNH